MRSRPRRGVALSTTTKPLVYRGVKEISDVAGINNKRFKHYVEKLGLPAFKIEEESNVWLASHEDLKGWIEERKRVYFGGEG